MDQLQDLPECGAVADDLIEVHLVADLFFEIKLLLGELSLSSEISRYARAFSRAMAIWPDA